MATKLKNLRLTSVDLVPRGANQEADICLYKSADDAESPTEREKNIFKRFLGWLRDNPAEAEYEDDSTIETEEEVPEDPADVYKSAIFESLQSILTDETLSAEDRGEMITKSIEEYHEAMVELAKFNHNHDALGRFASGGGGGGGAAGAKFNAKDAENKLNEIGRRRINGGAKNDDYEVLGETLHSAPVGTVYTETGNRGAKFQYTKTKDGDSKRDDEWEDEGGNTHSSHNLSMTWGGRDAGANSFKFDTADTAPTREEVQDSRTNAVNGQLRQWTGGKSDRYDEIEEIEVEKFNPNHDASGRFASGGGGGGVSHKPFNGGNAHAVLSEMPQGSQVTIRTDKRDAVFTKKENGTAMGVVWGYSDSTGGRGNMSQGSLGDIINSGGNRVFGTIKDAWTGKF